MSNPAVPATASKADIILHLGLAFGLYAVAQWISITLGMSRQANSGIWPAGAVGLVMVLSAPSGGRLLTVAATGLATLAVLVSVGYDDPLRLALLVAIPLLSAWGGAALITRLVGPRISVERSATLLRISALIAFVVCPAEALLWSVVLSRMSPLAPHYIFLRWYVPSVVMTLMLFPALWIALDWPTQLRRATRMELFGGVLTIILAVLAVAIVMLEPRVVGVSLPMSIAAVPILIMVAYRFGVGLTSWTSLAMFVAMLLLSYQEIGPFAQSRQIGFDRDVAVLLYMGTLGISLVLLAAVLGDLRAASQRFQSFLNSTDSMLVAVDLDRRVVGFSPPASQLYERLGGRRLAIGSDPIEQYRGPTEIAERRMEGYRRALRGESFSVVNVLDPTLRFEMQYEPMRDASGAVVGAIATAVDLNERERDEREQLRAGRLGAIGRLAGGVAHDINNLMTVVLGQTFFLREELHVTPAASEAIEEVEITVERTKRLTRQLLTFARAQVIAPRVVALPTQVDQTMGLVRRVLEEHIECMVEHRGEPWAIRIDQSQFEQLLLNLAANARDAMPTGGTVRIVTSTTSITETSATAQDITPGEYAVLEVHDTGEGIPADVIANIFDPFFSTKGSKGTGLGLATVQSIVRQAGGSATASSVRGEGTSFRMLFPRTLDAEEPISVTPVRPEPHGEARIVVCEDEPAIRRAIVRILAAVGYDVFEAESPAHALEHLTSDGVNTDLLITDIVMPGMSGPELIRQARALTPHLRVLLITGYADNALRESLASELPGHVLAKPFRGEELAERVRTTLTQSGA